MNDAVSRAIIHLYRHERFYAELIAGMNRVSRPGFDAVAGVCIKSRIELVINEKKFAELSLKEGVAVLKHECEHIWRNHIPRMKKYAPNVYKKNQDEESHILNGMRHMSLNIAADLSINTNIPDLPEWGAFPKKFDLPDGQTFEWYAGALKNNKDANGSQEFDNHSIWDESEGAEDIIKEKIRKLVTEAGKRAKNAGHLSSDHQLIIDELNPSKISWKAQLRRFLARSSEMKIDSSRKKRNRRYGIMYPGEVKESTLFIGVAIDTSGSVSDETLIQFMSEIHNLSKYAKVLVVEADAEIKKSYIYDPKKKYHPSGRGGTAYNPAFEFFNKEDIDGMIYFGDMDCFDEVLKKPNYPVLWAIAGTQTPPATWGDKIYVTED